MRAGARDGENVMQWKPDCTPLGPYHLTIGQNTSGNTDLTSKFEGQVTHFHQVQTQCARYSKLRESII